ncbi:MAG: hypothetical protein EOO19_03860 [Chryseobacterium sp.]|nr:MAG: hypothetical protein EOO19_03860 [Chryseobacterium sp.]
MIKKIISGIILLISISFYCQNKPFTQLKFDKVIMYDFEGGKGSESIYILDNNGKLSIFLETEIEGLDIYYSFDNSYPDNFYPKYIGHLNPPIDAKRIRFITYKGREPMGRMMSISMDELRKRQPTIKTLD